MTRKTVNVCAVYLMRSLTDLIACDRFDEDTWKRAVDDAYGMIGILEADIKDKAKIMQRRQVKAEGSSV